MFYATKQNKYIQEGTAFKLDGVQYPAVWMNQATAEQKAELGLQEVIAINSPEDSRYYWVSETLDKASLTYTNTPKDLDQLKSASVTQINNQVYTQLQPSDYMPSREFETGEPMNPAWKQYRAAVREMGFQSKAVIEGCKTVEELANFIASIVWPNDPNYVPPVEEQTPANGVV